MGSAFVHLRNGLSKLVPIASAALILWPHINPPNAVASPRFRVVDLHVDLPWQLHHKGRSLDLDQGNVTLASLRSGYVAGLVLPLYLTDSIRKSGPSEKDHLDMVDTIDSLINRHNTILFGPGVVPNDSDASKKVRTWLSFEGANALANKEQSMKAWVSKGVKLVGLAHMKDNNLASSSTGKQTAGASAAGLSQAGVSLAKATIAAGAILDVSHLSDASFDDIAKLAAEAKTPIVASHSNARAIHNHPRNLTDDQIRTIAKLGGTIGLNLHGPYLSSHSPPTLDDVFAQLDYLIKVAGEDHVSIGSDFDGGITPPAQLATASEWPTLASAMLARGYTEQQVHKVFSQNALRILNAR